MWDNLIITTFSFFQPFLCKEFSLNLDWVSCSILLIGYLLCGYIVWVYLVMSSRLSGWMVLFVIFWPAFLFLSYIGMLVGYVLGKLIDRGVKK